jgi:hypothetical protein
MGQQPVRLHLNQAGLLGISVKGVTMRTSAMMAMTDLVNFVLKSQHELSRLNLIASRDNPQVFRVYDFTARSGAAGTVVNCALDSDGQLTMTAGQGGRVYQAKLPFKGETLADLKASVRLTDKASTFDVDLSGKDFLDGANLPQDFRDLHQLIVRHVHRNLGWLSKGENVQSKTPETPQGESESISTTGTSEQDQQYRIRRSNGPDLQFQGKCVGLVRSVEHNGRYWRFSVFQTKGGNFIGVKEGLSRWFGELPKVDTVVVKTLAELTTFFGDTALARALYEQVGFDYVTLVE